MRLPPAPQRQLSANHTATGAGTRVDRHLVAASLLCGVRLSACRRLFRRRPAGFVKLPAPPERAAAARKGWPHVCLALLLAVPALAQNFENSPRVHELIRAGTLYLSLEDAL